MNEEGYIASDCYQAGDLTSKRSKLSRLENKLRERGYGPPAYAWTYHDDPRALVDKTLNAIAIVAIKK